MRTYVPYAEFAVRRIDEDPSALAGAAQHLSTICADTQGTLAAAAEGLRVLNSGLTVSLAKVDACQDFCRRAQAAFLPDGRVDEDAYKALVAEFTLKDW